MGYPMRLELVPDMFSDESIKLEAYIYIYIHTQTKIIGKIVTS